MCTNPSPLILGTANEHLVRLPDVLRIVADDPYTLVHELHRQARAEEGVRDLTVIDEDTPSDAAPRITAALADDDRPRQMVVLDLRDPLHPPVGPAAAALVRAAYTQGHPLLVLGPTDAPTTGNHTVVPAEAPFVALAASSEERRAIVDQLVARDRQDEAIALWTGGPAEALLVTADGVLTQAVTTTIPAQEEEAEAA